MNVVDASVVVEMLLRRRIGLEALARFASTGLHAPHLLDVEVAHALRRLAQAREVSPNDATIAIEALHQMRIERHAHLLLLPRVWELRDGVSAYDAVYLALAEALNAPLLTCDGKLSRSHGHHANIVLMT